MLEQQRIDMQLKMQAAETPLPEEEVAGGGG
jgi:hypothetical protein